MNYNGSIEIKVNIGKTVLQKRLLAIMSDRHAREEVHKELGEYCEPFVPKGLSGNLRKSMHATAKSVKWTAPYAHYQYEGTVWAPNIAIIKGGQFLYWRSKSPKHPTERELGIKRTITIDGVDIPLGYSTEGTMHHWFDRALTTKGMRPFTNRVTRILKQRARRLNKEW